MCGIAGTFGIPEPEVLIKYLKAIKHRGPDEGPSIIAKGAVRLGAVRLSIVDIKRGQQPMLDQKTGNILVQNGEVYNYASLRGELQKLRIKFETDCDTEVLLKGFTHFGPKFVEKLNGIFAIAFYKSKDDRLYLFRDYFGVKPLHYIAKRNTLKFSSEIKSFFTVEDNFKLDLDFVIFNRIFGCSLPEGSLYKNIRTLKPASYLSFKDGKLSLHGYLPRIEFSNPKTWEEAKKCVYNEIDISIKSQIPAEVDWGVLLSGGLDSSILTWLSQNNYGKRIQTYSVRPTETETEDSLNARLVAKFVGSRHIEVRVNPEEAINDFSDYLLTIEDINPRFLFYYYLAKAMKGKVKVGLCGEGSDELFAGYPVYRDLDNYTSNAFKKYKKFKHLLSKSMQNRVTKIMKSFKNEGFPYLYNFMIRYQMPYFQLNPVDKCSMRFGIELRVPYLSLNNSLTVMNLPKNWLLRGNIEKKLLRDSFAKSCLPTLKRKKLFAGTRTLPAFYQKLEAVAEKKYIHLSKKYPMFSKILDPRELYCLDLLDSGMRGMINKNHGRIN